MSNLAKICFPVALALLSSSALADPWKDESGNGRHGDKRGERKVEYWDGNCKVERKHEKNGEYKEERKCKSPKRYVQQPDYRYREPAHPDYRYRQPVVEQRTYYPVQGGQQYSQPGVAVDVRIRSN